MGSTAVAITAVLLLTPLTAAWSSFGAYEPDTVYDTPDYMWAEPGPAAANRVYFNAWSSVQTFVNANVGALETSNEAATMERHSAILGVWVDCNQDGYVGHAESALYEYRSELLLDDSVCEPVTGDQDNWTVGAHNYNGWVSELIPIGRPPEDVTNASDTRVYYDSLAKIWADQGLPDTPRNGGGGTCALNPFPRGTMQSTGGLMNYFDCRYDTIEAFNNAMALTGDPLGLSYPDPEDARGSPLDVPTFGSADTEHAAVYVVDCSADPMAETGSTVNDTAIPATLNDAALTLEDLSGEDIFNESNFYGLYDHSVPTLNPRTGDTSNPTIPGQFNETNEEFNDDCDTSNDRGEDFYSLLNEDDWNGDGADQGKRTATWSFTYHEGSRDVTSLSVRDTTISEDGTAGTPLGLGTAASYNFFSSGWYGIGNLVKNGPSTVVVRANVENPGVAIAPGYYLSFYAYVSPVITSSFLTPGGVGVYGAAQCGDNDEGVYNGWNCDPGEWNLNPDGTLVPGSELLAFVGDTYTLRDIDCYDGNIGLVGVGAGLPAYGDNPCQRPS